MKAMVSFIVIKKYIYMNVSKISLGITLESKETLLNIPWVLLEGTPCFEGLIYFFETAL